MKRSKGNKIQRRNIRDIRRKSFEQPGPLFFSCLSLTCLSDCKAQHFAFELNVLLFWRGDFNTWRKFRRSRWKANDTRFLSFLSLLSGDFARFLWDSSRVLINLMAFFGHWVGIMNTLACIILFVSWRLFAQREVWTGRKFFNLFQCSISMRDFF